MEKFFTSAKNRLPQSGDYLVRPRLHKLLQDALSYPLIVVCAGAGYGKTRLVHSFTRECDANTTWIQLSQLDNVERRFWENYVNMVTMSWPEAKGRLLELGLPVTEEAFAQFIALVRELATIPGKHIRVFDDVHLLNSPAVLRFCEQAIRVIPPNVTTFLISRTMPEVNLLGMMMRERVFTIQEETLCFTKGEIAQYLDQLKITVSKGDIQNMHNDTQGWAFAVNLIGRSMSNDKKYEGFAREAMKKNISRLIDAEISQTVSPPLWRFLLRLSLIEHLPADLVGEIAGDEALIEELAALNAYVRYDFRMDTYLIHHLLLDYLRQKQDQLTEAEKRETYQIAGKWCDANDYHLDALTYYEASGDYAAILRKVSTFNVHLSPDVAGYALEILDRAPDELKAGNYLFPAIHIRLHINLGRHNEETVALVRKYVRQYEALPDTPERNNALSAIYASWAFIRMYLCVTDDVYDFDVYSQKMQEYYFKNPYSFRAKFGYQPGKSWASLVGAARPGAHEDCIAAVSRMIPYITSLNNELFIGFEELLRGELCYLRGESNQAALYLRQAVAKTAVSDHFGTRDRSLVYLMQIALLRGDFAAAAKTLQELQALLSDQDSLIHYTMYDIANAFYHLALEQPEQTPEWLRGELSSQPHASFLEDYANRIKVQYHYQTRQHSALLAHLENKLGQEKTLFGRIELMVLQALSFYQLKRSGEAFAALAEAYRLAEANKLLVLFTQYGKDMRTLTAAALRDGSSPIPREWLEEVNRKASATAKRRAKMLADYRAAHHLNQGATLSKREIAIIKDLAQGLSRTEIAASQNLSINTVKKVVNTIYEKLNANSLADAIRLAADRKLI